MEKDTVNGTRVKLAEYVREGAFTTCSVEVDGAIAAMVVTRRARPVPYRGVRSRGGFAGDSTNFFTIFQ